MITQEQLNNLKGGEWVHTGSDYKFGYIAYHTRHTEDNIEVIYNMEEEGYYKAKDLTLVSKKMVNKKGVKLEQSKSNFVLFFAENSDGEPPITFDEALRNGFEPIY